MKKKFKEKDLPVYELVLSEDENDESGYRFISIVKDPAIGLKGMCFSEDKPVEFKFKVDRERQIIAGPAAIPNIDMYRRDEDGTEYYVRFTKDQIAKMVEKFNANPSKYKFNFNHTDRLVEAHINGQWLIENQVYDKSRFYGMEVPVGSWFVECKIQDANLWSKEVKEEGFYGFSVEGMFAQKLVKLEVNMEEEIANLLNQIDEINGLLK